MQPSDEELIAATPTDPAAFETFYVRHEREVLAWFARRTGSPELAADLAMETFAAALIGAYRYRPEQSVAMAWLFGIARHKLQRSLERGRVESAARRRLVMQPVVLHDEALAVIERLGAEVRALPLLDSLPADQVDAVRGRVVDELAYPDLASRLQCSEAVVRQRVSRGLATLRRRIKERL